LVLLGKRRGRQDDLTVVSEGDESERVIWLELVDGGKRGLLNALEPTDAGAVLLVHGAAHVQYQRQVQAQRLGGAVGTWDQFDEGIAGSGVACDRDAAAVHHAFDMNLGRHALMTSSVVSDRGGAATGPG